MKYFDSLVLSYRENRNIRNVLYDSKVKKYNHIYRQYSIFLVEEIAENWSVSCGITNIARYDYLWSDSFRIESQRFFDSYNKINLFLDFSPIFHSPSFEIRVHLEILVIYAIGFCVNEKEKMKKTFFRIMVLKVSRISRKYTLFSIIVHSVVLFNICSYSPWSKSHEEKW